jgi:hypothetical protein
MARMFPAEISTENPSTAEKRLFARLRDGLDNNWSVLHSLGLANHPTKPWAEIDFVLVGPPGLFCLEVKGGRLERSGGLWTFIDRHGRRNSKAQGPFEQVGSATGALRHYVTEHVPGLWDVAVGYGVATPDIPFKITGPDVEPDVVYDIDDAARPIAKYVGHLSEYWRARLEQQHGKPLRDLKGAEVGAIVRALRPDFDLRPSLRMRLGLIAEELLRLTEGQYQVLDGLQDNRTAVIRGGAGTGKTFLAIEEARRAARLGKRVFLCCFNRPLAGQVQKMVADEPLITAVHLHGFMARKIREAGLEDEIPQADESDIFTLFQPLVCLDALEALDGRGAYDVLIVDEAQDVLRESYAEVLNAEPPRVS